MSFDVFEMSAHPIVTFAVSADSTMTLWAALWQVRVKTKSLLNVQGRPTVSCLSFACVIHARVMAFSARHSRPNFRLTHYHLDQ